MVLLTEKAQGTAKTKPNPETARAKCLKTLSQKQKISEKHGGGLISIRTKGIMKTMKASKKGLESRIIVLITRF